jgi:glucose-6-phosphate 1-dehydrogenase
MSIEKVPPTTMVIFGATGDLTKRKLIPALYRLKALDLLPETFNIVGVATRGYSDSDFRDHAKAAIDAVKAKSATEETEQDIGIDTLFSCVRFVSTPFDNPAGYAELSKVLDSLDAGCTTPCSRLYYLATPPSFFPIIIEQLHTARLSGFEGGGRADDPRNDHTPKIIIEKPFGVDMESAKELNGLVSKHFREEQVYRIDHYLGKETVQNILFFRFANGIYEPIWNRRYIDHVQITAAEVVGIENRGKYFEEAGILRDMVQNHLLQLLSLVAMEPPISMEAEAIRSKKVDLLDSIKTITREEVATSSVRGQYGPSAKTGPGYRDEEGVNKESQIETFAALKLNIENWRWSGVPFYLRTGKRLKQNLTEIAIHFKAVPHCMFTETITGCPENNILVLKIQPDEGITFQFNVKRPGSSNYVESVPMDFSYKESFKTKLPEAYERLLLDCMLGDSTLFPHEAGIESSWRIITGILDGWKELPEEDFPNYAGASWGPEASDTLIEKDGRVWRNP